MFQSTIIVDPKSEIKGKQTFNSYIVRPSVIDRRESIRIKEVQAMLAWSAKSSFNEDGKIIIIEELHKASDAVPHALLKLLEEPPPRTVITITINQAEAALDTIRSRCAIWSARELSQAQLRKLGVYRQGIAEIEPSIHWQELTQKASHERVAWIAQFIKSKKDSNQLVRSWQNDVIEELGKATVTSRTRLVNQLALLEEVSSALRQNVLPRIALHYLNLRLEQL